MKIDKKKLIDHISLQSSKTFFFEDEISNNRGTIVYKLSSLEGFYFALKFTSKELNDQSNSYDSVEIVLNEIEFLIQNPNLSNSMYINSGIYNKIVWMVTCWMDGVKINDYLKSAKIKLSNENFKTEFLEQTKNIFLKLGKLHSENFVHSDIQPSHIFRDFNNQIQLIDFGLTHSYLDKSFNYKGGMIHFNAPEICKEMLDKKEKIQIDISSEVYSIASVIYFLYTQKTTTLYGKDLKELTLEEMLLSIANGKVKSFKEIGVEEFTELEKIITPCLSYDKNQRPDNLINYINSYTI